jgi:hypothetical protein
MDALESFSVVCQCVLFVIIDTWFLLFSYYSQRTATNLVTKEIVAVKLGLTDASGIETEQSILSQSLPGL